MDQSSGTIDGERDENVERKNHQKGLNGKKILQFYQIFIKSFTDL
jgi:hypothetical protein